MSGLTKVLLEAQDVNQRVRERAASQLEQMKGEALQRLLEDLAAILSDEAAPKNARLLAALTLKNTAKQLSLAPSSIPLWFLVSSSSSDQIHNCTLSTLASPDKDVRSAAAQAVATLASLDFPRKLRLDILDILVRNASNADMRYKQASIVTLGLICEETEREGLDKQQSDHILAAIAANIAQSDSDLQFNSLQALSNALKFARPNFESDSERRFLVSLLCAAAKGGDDRARGLALQVLCDVGILYYDFIAEELKEIWSVTSATMSQANEQLAILATEFWISLADIEKERQPAANQYLPQAAPALLPLLLANSLKYRPSDDDEWTLRKSSAALLSLLAALIGDPVLDACMIFVHNNITGGDWRRRNSAAMVFGAMLEAPQKGRMKDWVEAGSEVMLGLLGDESGSVRQTAVWVLGRISRVSSATAFPRLASGLLGTLRDTPNVAIHGCWALISLFERGEGVVSATVVEEGMAGLLDVVRKQAPRDDLIELQVAAFSALCSLIEKSPAECQPLLKRHLPVFLALLKGSLHRVGADTLQAFICSALQAICTKLPKGALKEEADSLVYGVVDLFIARQGVVEEGIQALGALAQSLEIAFIPYLATLRPFLIWSLSQRIAPSVCKSATLVVGDLARALGTYIDQYVNELVPLILKNLESEAVDADIKVQSIATLADLASNSESQFCLFLSEVLRLVDQATHASSTPVSPSDHPDLFEYLIDLREAILQFYVGLFQSVCKHFPTPSILDSVPKVVAFALYSTQDALRPSEDMLINALGLLGDISVSCGESVRAVISSRDVVAYLERGKDRGSGKVREVAKWAESTIVGNC